MSSFFNCAAYDDVDTTIRLNNHVVFLALKIKDKDSDMHITLNPFQTRILANQTRILAKYLTVALTQIDFISLTDEKLFGDLTVHIEQDNSQDEDFDKKENYALAVPF